MLLFKRLWGSSTSESLYIFQGMCETTWTFAFPNITGWLRWSWSIHISRFVNSNQLHCLKRTRHLFKGKHVLSQISMPSSRTPDLSPMNVRTTKFPKSGHYLLFLFHPKRIPKITLPVKLSILHCIGEEIFIHNCFPTMVVTIRTHTPSYSHTHKKKYHCQRNWNTVHFLVL